MHLFYIFMINLVLKELGTMEVNYHFVHV